MDSRWCEIGGRGTEETLKLQKKKMKRRISGHIDIRENTSTCPIEFSFNLCMPLPNLFRNGTILSGNDAVLLPRITSCWNPISVVASPIKPQLSVLPVFHMTVSFKCSSDSTRNSKWKHPSDVNKHDFKLVVGGRTRLLCSCKLALERCLLSTYLSFSKNWMAKRIPSSVICVLRT